MKKSLWLFLFLIVSVPAWATNKTVCASGCDYTTIAQVNALTPAPGDIISFKKGESWSEKLVPATSGVLGNPITYGSFGVGARPIIQGTGAGNLALDDTDKHYLNFSGIEFRNTYNAAASVGVLVKGNSWPNEYVWFDDCNFVSSVDQVGSAPLYIKNINTVKITNSIISGGQNGVYFEAGSAFTGHPMSVTIDNLTVSGQIYGDHAASNSIDIGDGAIDMTLTNSDISNFEQDGVDFYVGVGGSLTATGNKCHDVGSLNPNHDSTCFKLPQYATPVFTFTAKNNKGWSLNNGAAGGSWFFDLSQGVANVYLADNVATSSSQAYGVMGERATGAVIVNNTFKGLLRGIDILNGTATIQNNILGGGGAGLDLMVQNSSVVTGGNNIFVNDASATLSESGTYSGSNDKGTTDPLIDASLYTPSFNSPAVDAGRNSVCPTTDYNGNPRPSLNGPYLCDIGAVEFQYPFVGPTTSPYIILKGGTFKGGTVGGH